MTASTSRCAFAVDFPGGQVRRRRVLQVGVDLFDDRVVPMRLVHGDGVQPVRSVGVKNAWKRHTSNRVHSCGLWSPLPRTAPP